MFIGYTLSYKRDFGEWQEVPIDPDRKTYNLDGIKCGSNYQLYLTASNNVGTSKPSQVITAATKGSGRIYIHLLVKSITYQPSITEFFNYV